MDLEIIGGSGPAPGSRLAVDPTFGAARVGIRPLDYGLAGLGGKILGHYRASMMTGLTTGIAANGAILSLRWADTVRLFVPTRIQVGCAITTAFTAAQALDAEAIIARAFTASDTGGTAILLTNDQQKMRGIMGSSLVTDLRVATTAALGAGTRTLDGVGIGITSFPNTNGLGSGSSLVDLYAFSAYHHPPAIALNEGLIVRLPTAQGAVGVVKYYLVLEWAEVAAI